MITVGGKMLPYRKCISQPLPCNKSLPKLSDQITIVHLNGDWRLAELGWTQPDVLGHSWHLPRWGNKRNRFGGWGASGDMPCVGELVDIQIKVSSRELDN